MIKKTLCLVLLLLFTQKAVSEKIDTLLSMNTKSNYNMVTHMTDNFNLQCMGLDRFSAIKGTCIWLKCGWGCRIRTSLIIEHKMPDLLVEATASSKKSPLPYIEMVKKFTNRYAKFMNWKLNPFLSSGAKRTMGDVDIGGGVHSGKRGKATDNNNVFDVTIIGNPYLPLYEELLAQVMDSLEIGSSCASQVNMFTPYFTSTTSLEWRFGLMESVLSLKDTGSSVLGKSRHLNNYGLNFDLSNPAKSFQAGLGFYWGYVYPRTGTIKNKSIYRSAAVSAFRAVDVATGSSGLHTSTSGQWVPKSPNKRKRKTWPIPSIEPGEKTHRWQMNYPQGKRSGCYNFPDTKWDGADFRNKRKSRFASNVNKKWSAESDLTSDSNTYIWTLWRTYKCCTKKGSLITAIEW